ncbi:hypothetical protein NEMIN01_0395 [Nematocida minor]|uniref:uncharacterized protein n=1 Tax=Nematocida minor TaxID=1912983 RepID=UPI00221EF47F|nr:uncharacterized protein NEMIN01_0395 [Nematocida minor]KAI5189229.1 hypothetical protein NEMIN01_0395 [Nematocida minor]
MRWMQTYREVSVVLPLEKKATDRISITAGDRLVIRMNKETVLDRELYLPVKEDECIWSFENKEVDVLLVKKEMGPWKSLFKGDPEEVQDIPVEPIGDLSELGDEAQKIIERAMEEENIVKA